MASVLDLPEEILFDIFQLTAEQANTDYIQGTLNDKPTRPPYSWLSLTHVCRLWRSTAINNPLLWTNVVVTSPEAVEEIVKRSENQALSVFFTLHEVDAPKVHVVDALRTTVLLALTDMPCLRRLKSITMPAIPELWDPDLAAQSQSLASLEMIQAFPGSYDRDHLIPFPQPLHFPALRRFVYKDAPSYPITMQYLCSTLRELVFRPYPVEDLDIATPITAAILARALSQMPHLEELEVRVADVLADSDEEENHSDPDVVEVHLNNLRTLRMVGSTRAIAALYRQLRFPPTIPLDFDCWLADDHAGYHEIVMPAVLTLEHMLTNPSLCTRSLVSTAPVIALSIANTGGYYELRGWRSMSRPEDLALQKPDVTMHVPWFDDMHSTMTFFSAFQLHAVDHLQLGQLPAQFAETMRSSENICATIGHSSLCLDAVFPLQAVQYIARTRAPHVILQDVNFQPPDDANAAIWQYNWVRDATPTIPRQYSRNSSFRDFVLELSRGKQNKRTVQKISLLRVRNVQAADVETLRALVDDVQWDGQEIIDLYPCE